MTTRKAFFANLFIASPVLIALLGAYHLVHKISAIPECTISAPREVPRCMPEATDEEAITSLEDADSGLYLACERHQGNTGKPDTPRVVAMMEAQ